MSPQKAIVKLVFLFQGRAMSVPDYTHIYITHIKFIDFQALMYASV